MWILVINQQPDREERDGVAFALKDLGCRVRVRGEGVNFADFASDPPTACVIEISDDIDFARYVRQSLLEVPALRQVAILVALPVSALARIDPTEHFDDVVLTPIIASELLLRIRRAEWKTSEFDSQERIKVGALLIDLAAHEAHVDGQRIQLTPQEYSLLKFFAINRGRAFSRLDLLARVWGVQNRNQSRTVDIHVRRLRSKLGVAADSIETVRAVGYKFRAN